ncbi:hypothetical protein D3C72_819350 [compost metagenome]
MSSGESSFYGKIPVKHKGAWVVHHGQKTSATVNAAAEFPALDTAGKAASLLSQLAASDEEASLSRKRVEALSKAAGLNPKIETPALLSILARQRLVDLSSEGDVTVLGLTSSVTVQHAASIFEDQEPTSEEKATIALAEMTSDAPVSAAQTKEFISDEFRLTSQRADDVLSRSETMGFVDAEGIDGAKLLFNGNLFRRDTINKTRKVLDSLSSQEVALVSEIDERLSRLGCLAITEVERHLSPPLLSKLRAAGMYDVNFVSNTSGETGFITKPSAFHKFNDPVVDDAFDLAKALVAALSYGMTQSSSGRGKIDMIGALLRKLNAGYEVGPATAIGEDYRVLETKGVLKVTKAPRGYGYTMRLLKKDVGEMAYNVLITGETAAGASLERPLPGNITTYSGPEASRWRFRQKEQKPASRRQTQDVLEALRTTGNF